MFSTNKRKKTVVCFKNIGEKILNETWYQQKCKSEAEERLRIVEAAAKIICDDIRSQVYDVKEYPAPDRFLEEVESVIPETLKNFLDTLIVKRKKGEDTEKWTNKCQAISHSIISAVRPRSFLSNLQIGLATFVYKKFGSRKLIDVLSSLGFCSSYSETVQFEISSTLNAQEKVAVNGFMQFVYDNADFNTQTTDGYNTFHVLGGVVAISPASAVPPDVPIQRMTRIPAADVAGKFGLVNLQHFEAKEGGDGLKAIKFKDLSYKFGTCQNSYSAISAIETLWLFSKQKECSIGWNAFMEQATQGLTFQKT